MAISAPLKNHIQQSLTTLCTIWRVQRMDGKVYCFTDFSEDITYRNELYHAAVGYRASAIKSNSLFNVDNLEITGPLGNVSTAIEAMNATLTMTDADIDAGLWDYAEVLIMRVNWDDLSMGHMTLKKGIIGQINTGRLTYQTELRGMTQPLQQSVGRVFTAACTANFADDNCKMKKEDYTFNGSVTEFISQKAWQDTSLNQTNSAYSQPILLITNTNPVVVTCNAHGLTSGEQITFSNVAGMEIINGLTFPIQYLTANTFSVAFDGSASPFFGFGGVITKVVVSEYFKDGVVHWLTGKNAGIKCGVKKYRPNYVELYEQLVFDIEVGDTYTIIAGCDKLVSTCHERFDNIINFYGFNLIPGQDRFLSGT